MKSRTMNLIKLARAVALPVASLTLVACGGPMYHGQMEDLKRRAAFDLQCSQDQIQVVALSEGTQGVTGCGRQATYVEHCNGPRGSFGTRCDWALNSAPVTNPSTAPSTSGSEVSTTSPSAAP